MNHGDALAVLEDELGVGAVLEHESQGTDLWVRVRNKGWRQVGEVAKKHLGCTYFSFLSAIDWLPNPDLDGEHAFDRNRAPASSPEIIALSPPRIAGGDTRFQVFARVANVLNGFSIIVSADIEGADIEGAGDLRIASWTSVYRGANWHERETWEMFGILFDGHPGLRHIYLPGEFEGFPLRKDFPLLARQVRPWPGLVDMEEMPKVEGAIEPEEDSA